MWDCGNCGCRSITPGVPFCPQCFKEREMPSNPVGAAPSNARAVEGESGYIAPEADASVTDAENVTVKDTDTPPAPAEAVKATRKPGK